MPACSQWVDGPYYHIWGQRTTTPIQQNRRLSRSLLRYVLHRRTSQPIAPMPISPVPCRWRAGGRRTSQRPRSPPRSAPGGSRPGPPIGVGARASGESRGASPPSSEWKRIRRGRRLRHFYTLRVTTSPRNPGDPSLVEGSRPLGRTPTGGWVPRYTRAISRIPFRRRIFS